MAQGTLVNTYVFLLCFAFSFLIGGKRPILTLSTRALLVGLLGSAIGYATSEQNTWHAPFGAATLIFNVLFIGFALIDYVNWYKRKTQA